jgi:hypothetical protein
MTGGVALCFDDEEPPFSFLVIDGEARIDRDPDALLQWATTIGVRYMGDERGAEFGRPNAVPTELLVRVHPTRVTGHWNISE